MKFPYMIIAILIIVGLVGFLYSNVNIHYEVLETTHYISPEHGSIKMNTNLYFVFENELRVENKMIQVDNDNYGAAILDAIQLGAENKLYSSIFIYPIEFESVDLIGETCYINFVKNDALGRLLDDNQLSLYIWSIVNSVTDTNQIKSVQFLVDGKYIDKALNGFNLNKPLVKRESLVYQKQVTPTDIVIDFITYMNTMRYDLAYSLLTKETMQTLDYSTFVRYANAYKKKFNEYELGTSYSFGYVNYTEVVVNYIKDYEADGLSLKKHSKFKVYTEENVYRIGIDGQLD